MEFDEIELRHVRLDLKKPFRTSFGKIEERNLLILGAKKDGKWFYGETSPLQDPVYNHETTFTAKKVITSYVIPALEDADSIDEYHEELSGIKGHKLAIAAGDQLMYHFRSYREKKPISELIGGHQKEARCGVSIGLKSKDEIVDAVQGHVDEGYDRIKVKIKPGQDIEYLRKIRDHFPNIQMMADANSAYSLEDSERLKQLDELDLQMIEQPLSHRDLVNHSLLADRIGTPICLDESILSAEDVKRASRIGAGEIINLKPQRVSGLRESEKINKICRDEGMKMWIGGLVESGIGASSQIIASSLGQVSLPGDIGSSKKYFKEDILKTGIEVENGKIRVPDRPGLVSEVDREVLKEKTIELVEN